jgi:hypothetical protein
MSVAAKVDELIGRLDDLGKPAWIALVVVGFWLWWPVGVAALAFIIGSGRVGCRGGSMNRGSGRPTGSWWYPPRSSGNKAFDEYRHETLRRLEEEQREFQEFLARLRMARDKAEFDQFMAERRTRAGSPS